jgi:hypothetical protein
MKKTVEFVSPHPVEECKRRIEAQMNTPFSVLALAEARPLIGRFRETWLRARRRPLWYRNSFQTYLSAELVAEDGETRIRCRFSMHPLVKAFMTLWFSVLVLVGGFMFIDALRPDVARGFALAVPLMLMLVGGAALVGFGRYMARGDRRFLTDLVQKTLNAKCI